jgi:rhodanese-related sulfurtransferase
MYKSMMLAKRNLAAKSIALFMATTLIGGLVWCGEIGEVVKEMVTDAKDKTGMISVDELSAIMEADKDIVIVDIRTESEYITGHLKKSIWIPRGKLEFLAGGKLPSLDAELVVYCRIDSRAALAAQTMTAMGYENVKYLKGGFMEWAKAGYPIYNKHGKLIVEVFEEKENTDE